jgi:hypothetical protein
MQCTMLVNTTYYMLDTALILSCWLQLKLAKNVFFLFFLRVMPALLLPAKREAPHT